MRGLFQNIFAVIMWKPCVCEAKSPTAFSTALVRTKQIKQSMAFCIAKAIVCYDPNDQKKSPRNILRSISRHGQLYVCQLRVAWKESIIAQKTTAKFFNAYQSSEINIFQDKSMTTTTVWYLCRMTLTSFLPCSSWILWESNHRFFFFFFKWVNEQVGHLISIAVHLVKKTTIRHRCNWLTTPTSAGAPPSIFVGIENVRKPPVCGVSCVKKNTSDTLFV